MADASSDNVEDNAAPTNGENGVKVEGNPWDSPPQSPVDGVVQPRTVPPPDKPTRHTNQLEFLYNNILKDAIKKKNSWPFKSPVNAVTLEIPEYHNVISKPMDLTTIMARVKNVYYYSAQEAVQDVMLMFTNCFTFNPPEYGVYQMAKQLEEYFLARLPELPPEEEEIPKIVTKRGPKAKKRGPPPRASNLPTSSKMVKEELTPEFQHVIDHFHRATRAMSSLPDGDKNDDSDNDAKPTDDSKETVNDSVSRESSVVSIQQKDADSSIVDTHDDNEPLASTSNSMPELTASTSKAVGGVKRKADTTTIDDETSAKIGSRRESSRPVKKPNLFLDYNSGATPVPQRKAKTSDSMKFCTKVLNELHSKKYKDFMWPFYKPVDVEGLKLTDYHDIISHPMDLSTVRKNLEQKEYESAQEFADDIRLISKNCCTYNPAESDVYKHGVSLLKLFEAKFRDCPVEDDYSDIVALSVQTDLNDDDKLNNLMGFIKTEQKKASERMDELRALHEKMYEILIVRREAKLNGTHAPAIDSSLLVQMEKLGIPVGSSFFNEQSTPGDDIISPTTSVRSSSRAPVPKLFDDIRMDPAVKPAPVKKSVSRPSVPMPVEVVPEPPKSTGPRRGRRPGSKNRPKGLITKKMYHFDSDDDAVTEPMTYTEKHQLSQQIQALDPTLISEIIRIIERRKGPDFVYTEEMEIDFEEMDNVTLHELHAFVKFELARDKKPKKMMPIKNAAEAEKKKLEIQAELQVLNTARPTLAEVAAGKSKPSGSQGGSKKARAVSESSSSGSESSSTSSSDSDSEDEAAPRLDELTGSSKVPNLTNLMKKPAIVKPVVPPPADPVNVETSPTDKNPATPEMRETTPPSRTESPLSAKTEQKESGSSPADILARSYVHPSGHAKIENMLTIRPTGDASISILDQILPETLSFEAEKEKHRKAAREKEAKEAELANKRRLEWEQNRSQQNADDEELVLQRQAEARRKRQLELADTVGVNEQQEMMFNFETSF